MVSVPKLGSRNPYVTGGIQANMVRFRMLPLLLLVSSTGCVRREGRNADCRWPGEPGGEGQVATFWHLSADAEFAEELAIRYMDAHHGPRSGNFASHASAGRERDRCLGTLLTEVGRTHRVEPRQVFAALGRNRTPIDVAVNLPFFLLYAFAASRVARRRPGLVMLAFWSLAFGVGAVLLGEQWSGLAESLRIGNGHLSNRAFRLPWVRYPVELFALSVALFWTVAAVRSRLSRRF